LHGRKKEESAKSHQIPKGQPNVKWLKWKLNEDDAKNKDSKIGTHKHFLNLFYSNNEISDSENWIM
jgi:hypothetical protein